MTSLQQIIDPQTIEIFPNDRDFELEIQDIEISDDEVKLLAFAYIQYDSPYTGARREINLFLKFFIDAEQIQSNEDGSLIAKRVKASSDYEFEMTNLTEDFRASVEIYDMIDQTLAGPMSQTVYEFTAKTRTQN